MGKGWLTDGAMNMSKVKGYHATFSMDFFFFYSSGFLSFVRHLMLPASEVIASFIVSL